MLNWGVEIQCLSWNCALIIIHFSLYPFIIERSPSGSRSSSSSPSTCEESTFAVNKPSVERPQASPHYTSDGGEQISSLTPVSALETANATNWCQEYTSPQLASFAVNEHSLKHPQKTSCHDSSDSTAPVRTVSWTITSKWCQEMQVPRPHPTFAINEQSLKFPQTRSYPWSHHCNPTTTPVRTETTSTTTWRQKMEIPRPHPSFAINSQSSKFTQTSSYPWSGCSSSEAPVRSETAATTTWWQEILIPRSHPTPAIIEQSPKVPPAGSYPWSSKAPVRTDTANSVTWGQKLIGPPPLFTTTINEQSCYPASIHHVSDCSAQSSSSTPETATVTIQFKTQSVTSKTGCQEPLNPVPQPSTHESCSSTSRSTLEHTRLTPSSDNSTVGNRSKGFSSQTMQETPRDITKAFSSVVVSSHSMSCHEATRDVPQIDSNNSVDGDDSALLSWTLPKTEDFLDSLHTASPRGKITFISEMPLFKSLQGVRNENRYLEITDFGVWFKEVNKLGK